jgi:oxalate decarboxylase/phosphoglucose isomerase-like protein (cupin superfamily)
VNRSEEARGFHLSATAWKSNRRELNCGGVVRGASVRQFPVSKGIAGASMRLQPGCLRELHWLSTAAELGYVVSGSCRTTVLSPEGAETDTFGPGDVWYFPRGCPGNRVKRVPFHSDIRRRRLRRGAYT